MDFLPIFVIFFKNQFWFHVLLGHIFISNWNVNIYGTFYVKLTKPRFSNISYSLSFLNGFLSGFISEIANRHIVFLRMPILLYYYTLGSTPIFHFINSCQFSLDAKLWYAKLYRKWWQFAIVFHLKKKFKLLLLSCYFNLFNAKL